MVKAIIIIAVILIMSSTGIAYAWLVQGPSGGAAPATSCVATLTGSGTGGAILTGTATALAKLTCQ